jgi:hypothetical protein
MDSGFPKPVIGKVAQLTPIELSNEYIFLVAYIISYLFHCHRIAMFAM